MSITRYSIKSKNIIKKTIPLIGIFFIILFSFDRNVWADSSKDVTVKLDSRLEQNSSHFLADIAVSTSNPELFNDKVYLSYHVYDSKDKEILWEGGRIPLTLNEMGDAKLTVDLDLSLVLPSKDLQHAKLKFDFVDEKNVYWFSRNENINLISDTIVIDQSFFNKFVGTVIYAVIDTPIIFSLNTVFLLATIYLLFRMKNSELLSS